MIKEMMARRAERCNERCEWKSFQSFLQNNSKNKAEIQSPAGPGLQALPKLDQVCSGDPAACICTERILA